MIVFCVIIDYAMDNDSQKTTKSIAIIAIVAALAVLGVVIVLAVVPIPVQEAEARPNTSFKSCDPLYTAFNASQGRCFHP
jgi:hypothetical protein